MTEVQKNLAGKAVSEKHPIKLEDAKKIADEVVRFLEPMCERIEVAGSIRRKRVECKDIDIVLMLKPQYSMKGIQYKLENEGAKTILAGDKFVQQNYKETQVDMYRADKNNFEIIFLIRTGSANHNKMLCSKALAKGLKMKFDLGLIDSNKNVVANTEDGILKELLGEVVSPEEREV